MKEIGAARRHHADRSGAAPCAGREKRKEGKLAPRAAESGAPLRTAGFAAAVFDLDAVLTGARMLHAEAWKNAFDRLFCAIESQAERPFSIESEYAACCHGRPPIDAAAAVLAARDVQLRPGTPDAPPGIGSIHALVKLTHEMFLSLLDARGIDRGGSALGLVAEFRRKGLHTAVVSPSRHCIPVLAAAGALELFDAKLDGTDAARASLSPKPAPDFLTAMAHELDVQARQCIAVEDSEAGIRAARKAGYGLVIAIARDGPDQAEALSRLGADTVLDDQYLDEFDTAGVSPLSGSELEVLRDRLGGAAPALFVDYEGTLASKAGLPADDPRAERLKRLLARLARRYPTAVISECDLEKLRSELDVPGLVYAARDGLEVELPDGRREQHRPESAAGMAWDRGEALQRLLSLLGLAEDGSVVPVYVGDDIKDEDAFAAIDERGIGISVGGSPESTIAPFTLPDREAVWQLLAWFSRQ